MNNDAVRQHLATALPGAQVVIDELFSLDLWRVQARIKIGRDLELGVLTAAHAELTAATVDGFVRDVRRQAIAACGLADEFRQREESARAAGEVEALGKVLKVIERQRDPETDMLPRDLAPLAEWLGKQRDATRRHAGS